MYTKSNVKFTNMSKNLTSSRNQAYIEVYFSCRRLLNFLKHKNRRWPLATARTQSEPDAVQKSRAVMTCSTTVKNYDPVRDQFQKGKETDRYQSHQNQILQETIQEMSVVEDSFSVPLKSLQIFYTKSSFDEQWKPYQGVKIMVVNMM